jgi:hypothetical protein
MKANSKIARQESVYKFSIYREILIFCVLLLIFIVTLKKHVSPLKILLFSILIYFIYNIHYINSATIEGFANAKTQKQKEQKVQPTKSGVKPDTKSSRLTPVQTTTKPVATKPVATKPVATKPVAIQPVAIQPVAIQPVAIQPVAIQPLAQPLAQSPAAIQPLAQPLAQSPDAIQPLAQSTPKCIEAPINPSIHINDDKILSRLEYANQHINTIEETQYNKKKILDSISQKTNILAESELNNKQQFNQLSKDITSIYNSIYSLRELLKSEMTENLFKINNQLYRLITIMEENKNEEISKISKTIINEMNSLKKELRSTNKLYSSIDGSWNNQY